ncbi:MAG: hypothetical protein ACOCPT_04960 [Halanaeroarchaeum sp.]
MTAESVFATMVPGLLATTGNLYLLPDYFPIHVWSSGTELRVDFRADEPFCTVLRPSARQHRLRRP